MIYAHFDSGYELVRVGVSSEVDGRLALQDLDPVSLTLACNDIPEALEAWKAGSVHFDQRRVAHLPFEALTPRLLREALMRVVMIVFEPGDRIELTLGNVFELGPVLNALPGDSECAARVDQRLRDLLPAKPSQWPQRWLAFSHEPNSPPQPKVTWIC